MRSYRANRFTRPCGTGFFHLSRRSRHYEWIFLDFHGLPASVSLPALAPRPLRRFIATMRVLTPHRFSHRDGVSQLHADILQDILSPTTRCSTATVFFGTFPPPGNLNMLLPVLRQAFTPHEYGLHLASAGSPLASSRIAFVSYGLSFPLPLLPTPPHGDAVTVEYKPERSVWRELSSLDMFAPTGALAQATRLR